MKFQSALSLAAVVGSTSAHTIFTNLKVGSTTNPVGYGIRVPSYDGPIQDVSSNDITCNGGPNPTTPSNKVIDVKAGDTVQAIWRHTLTSGSDDVIDASHKGPTIAYLKKVTDATTDSGIGGGWFKIQEAGYNAAKKTWAIDDLIASGGVHDIKIPSCIANGQYLLRGELIALHSAGSSGGAQFYMECAQINVSGGTGTATPSTVAFPGAYKATDPGILINIYQTLTGYTIPGPALFTCGANNGPSVPDTPSEPGTTLVTSSKPTATATPSDPSGAPLYGQCGGSGWGGATTCAQGSCKATNEWYSKFSPPSYTS